MRRRATRVYFADAEARAYAVDAATGKELWTRKVDDHRAARATGAPTLHAGRLYVVTSGVSEETRGVDAGLRVLHVPRQLDLSRRDHGRSRLENLYGRRAEAPRHELERQAAWGPAGSPIWSAPTIDEKRGLIYAATGNAYADPAPRTSDAIVAFEIASGRIRWVNQIMPDTWILGCGAPLGGGDATTAEDNPNCPADVGPDFDFSASPVLVTLANGRDGLVVTQKSGVGYLLDPERRGREIWEYRWGRGSPVGGVWGATVDGSRAYFRRRRSADAGARRLACRGPRDGTTRVVHAAARARLRAGPGLQPGAIRGADLDARRRALGRRRRRRARLRERRRQSALDVRYEPRLHDRQRREGEWQGRSTGRGPSSRAECST